MEPRSNSVNKDAIQRSSLQKLVESSLFEKFIISIIIINAITLGIETNKSLSKELLNVLGIIDNIFFSV